MRRKISRTTSLWALRELSGRVWLAGKAASDDDDHADKKRRRKRRAPQKGAKCVAVRSQAKRSQEALEQPVNQPIRWRITAVVTVENKPQQASETTKSSRDLTTATTRRQTST